MIDTIRMKINTTKDSGFHDRMLGAGYSYAEQHKIDQDGVSNENRVYTNPSNGLRISGDEIHATSLEVSLPRLLKGSNGLLIRDQGELDQATSQLENEIESVMELPDEYKVTRIDSCVHVKTPCGTSDVYHWQKWDWKEVLPTRTYLTAISEMSYPGVAGHLYLNTCQ